MQRSYWLASQADVIAAAPSSCIGSIGVYMALLDETRALEMEGYTVNLIKAGKHKAMGASFQKLTDEERAIFQGQVDSIYADFKKPSPPPAASQTPPCRARASTARRRSSSGWWMCSPRTAWRSMQAGFCTER
ncbi:S49 family peptidase [Verrucomicrobium spinosum]|uniref:S49 family peptidase n=1 Tax=Verrucomicrobium spinosum TaxID=2736 RepID=UPI000A499A3C|nr:S49 family peptidase [Verrucomicrobium spinosum]